MPDIETTSNPDVRPVNSPAVVATAATVSPDSSSGERRGRFAGLCECGLRHPLDTACADEWAAEDERRRDDDDRDWHELPPDPERGRFAGRLGRMIADVRLEASSL